MKTTMIVFNFFVFGSFSIFFNSFSIIYFENNKKPKFKSKSKHEFIFCRWPLTRRSVNHKYCIRESHSRASNSTGSGDRCWKKVGVHCFARNVTVLRSYNELFEMLIAPKRAPRRARQSSHYPITNRLVQKLPKYIRKK